MIILKLFWAFLTIGIVSFGGGYAMLPLFERVIVVDRGWLTMARFIDMIAISQVTPGPIAINSATFIGYQTAGVIGSAVSTLGVITIPVIFVSIAAKYREQFKTSVVIQRILKGLRPALVGLIMASVYSVAQNADLFYDTVFDLNYMNVFLLFFLLFALTKLRIHPILVIILSGVIGVIIHYII